MYWTIFLNCATIDVLICVCVCIRKHIHRKIFWEVTCLRWAMIRQSTGDDNRIEFMRLLPSWVWDINHVSNKGCSSFNGSNWELKVWICVPAGSSWPWSVFPSCMGYNIYICVYLVLLYYNEIFYSYQLSFRRNTWVCHWIWMCVPRSAVVPKNNANFPK